MALRNIYFNLEDAVPGKIRGAVVVLQRDLTGWVPPNEDEGESWDGWPPPPESEHFLHVLFDDEGAPADLTTVSLSLAEFQDDLPPKLKKADGGALHEFWGTKAYKNQTEKDNDQGDQGENEQ